MYHPQMERDEEQLDEDLRTGKLTNAEHSKEMRELHWAYQAEAEEAAKDAYQNEMNNWY